MRGWGISTLGWGVGPGAKRQKNYHFELDNIFRRELEIDLMKNIIQGEVIWSGRSERC